MDVFAHMTIIVIIAGICVHVWAKERAFCFSAHLEIIAFITSVSFCNNIATGMNARCVGNMPLV